MQKIRILFFTGCSGAGKTAIVNALQDKLSKKDTVCLYFDSTGVPSNEEMIRKYGSGENWQKETTQIWVDKMLSEHKDAKLILFEGQVNLLFIKQAFAKHNFTNYQIILVHCDSAERHKRLAISRNQPELVNDDMDNWSDYLYNQAKEESAYILDTTSKSINETTNWCINEFDF